MRASSLIEDLNRLACVADQDGLADEPVRARETLNALRHLDTSQLGRFEREGLLTRAELDLIERFATLTRERLRPLPADVDPIAFTRADPGWQIVRERAIELLVALDAFIDIGVPGWGRQHARGR